MVMLKVQCWQKQPLVIDSAVIVDSLHPDIGCQLCCQLCWAEQKGWVQFQRDPLLMLEQQL